MEQPGPEPTLTWDTGESYAATVPVPKTPLLLTLPSADMCPGKQQLRAQVPGSLLPTREAWTELLVAGLGLAQPWLLGTFGE